MLLYSYSKKQSKLLRGILLGTAGISVIAALSVVITSQNQRSLHSTNSNVNKNLFKLKLSPRENRVPSEDLTILGENEGEVQENVNPIVRISRQGRVQGTILKSRQNRDYYAFYKIPYARPPLGQLRFAPPQAPGSWPGVRDGTTEGPECIQMDKYATELNTTAGSEDCLFLNIYTPKLPENRKKSVRAAAAVTVGLPVMFYIHGGGGPFGSGTRYGAKYMMDEDVLLVTVEFRLGMFDGFTTGTKEYPGNLGARDQIAALKWVQRNIERFGGDRKKVLLFGNSSGGGFIHAHLLSPMSQGLFHRAIIQSGSCMPLEIDPRDPIETVRDFSLEVGCGDLGLKDTVETVDETIVCLRGLSAETIALSLGQLAISFLGIIPEGYEGDAEDKFLTDIPWKLLQEGRVRVGNQVPVIVGINSREFMGAFSEMLLHNDTVKELNSNFNDLLPGLVGLEDDGNQTMAKKFRQVYFGTKEISNDSRLQLWDITSDHFVHPFRISGLAHANISSQPTYFYWLNKEPAFSYAESTKKIFPPPYGVAHADELQYLFPYYGYPEYPVDSPWFEFSQKLVKIWVSFARDEKPDIKGPGVDFEWEPISLEDNGMKYLQLDDEIKYVQPFTKRMELWDEYVEELYG